MNKPERWAKQAHTIRAELVGAGGCHCAVAGLYACANNPVLEMCHLLVSAGYHPDSKLVCFRGGALSLTVHSIGVALQLKVYSMETGTDCRPGVRKVSRMHKLHSSATSAAPTKRRSNRPLKMRERWAGKKRVNV